MLSFGQAVRTFYGRYADFKGRSQRSEYWWVQLFFMICYGVLFTLIFMGLGGLEGISDVVETENLESVKPAAYLGIIGLIIFFLANLIPSLALQVRRFHDLGQTGWLVLAFMVAGQIPLIQIFSGLGNIIWFTFRGTDGLNKYGPDPLQPLLDVFE